MQEEGINVCLSGWLKEWVPIVSGVPQGAVLGPLLFSMYINDISADIESEIRLFADDCLCYHEIKEIEDTVKKLEKDIDRLGSLARDIRFQPVKCIMMQLTKEPTHNFRLLAPLMVQYWKRLKVSNTLV